MTTEQKEKKNVPGWYAIYTAPRAEKKLVERLGLLGYEIFLPTIRVRKIWSDRIKMVDQVLFPSYVFVHCAPTNLRDIIYIEGAVKIVYYNNAPAQIREQDIQEIRNFILQAAECQIEIGEQVQILTGGLKLVTGKVTKIGRTHLYLYLEQLGAFVCVRKDNVKKSQKA